MATKGKGKPSGTSTERKLLRKVKAQERQVTQKRARPGDNYSAQPRGPRG